MDVETSDWKDVATVVWCTFLIVAAILAIVPGWPVVADALASDVAPAWVQALGSVGAILVAIWVSQWQVRNTERSTAVTAILMTRSFGAHLAGLAEKVVELAPTNDYGEFKILHAVVEEVMRTGRLIHAEQLSMEWMGAIHGLRSTGAQMCAFLEGIQAKDLQGMWAQHTCNRFNGHRKNIEGYLAIVKQQHPGIPVPSQYRSLS